MLPNEIVSYYKGLIGQIEIALPTSGGRVLMLSSSIEGEGTTDVALGLGLTLATEMDRKVAIVDCNLRHPEIHLRFGTQDVGLSEYFSGEVELEQALVNTVVPNLYALPLGRNLTSLAGVGSERLRALLETLRDKFDYVLIDAAPIGTYAECVVLCDKVDAIILIIRHGSTRREVVKRTKEIIDRAGGRILGVVLNRRKFPIPEFLYRKI